MTDAMSTLLFLAGTSGFMLGAGSATFLVLFCIPRRR